MKITNQHSPIHLFIITAISVFVSEAFIMLILSELSLFSIPISVMFLDALLLTFFIVPVLYFFLVRPLGLNIEERLRTEEDLKKARGELEIKVMERTDELNRTNATLQQEMIERTQAELESLKTAMRLEHLLHSVPAIINNLKIVLISRERSRVNNEASENIA